MPVLQNWVFSYDDVLARERYAVSTYNKMIHKNLTG